MLWHTADFKQFENNLLISEKQFQEVGAEGPEISKTEILQIPTIESLLSKFLKLKYVKLNGYRPENKRDQIWCKFKLFFELCEQNFFCGQYIHKKKTL